ncbi:MAG: glycosyltransferase family 4 protein [Anaerolineae bacterium]|nr:glycosyltransferase family 4 protein [Anaerolineae bacterium]
MATHPQGDSRKRHLAYALRAGAVTVIAYTPAGVGGPIQASESLRILPTNSRSKLLFPLDAVRLAVRVAAERRVDLITTQDPFVTGLVGWWLRRRLNVPLLVQNHSYFFDNRAWLRERPLINTLLQRVGRFVVAQADLYRTVNRKERDSYIARGGSSQRSVALPLGTASDAFAALPQERALADLRRRLDLKTSEQVVLWVGYPVAFKRVPLLFKVFRRVIEQQPFAHLVLIGDMSRSPDDLRALARDEGIAGAVTLYGPVPHDELPLYYALGEVYVHTSSYEGVPRVLFEASAAGLGIVAFNVVGVNEIIEDGVNGYLAPDLDVDGLAGRIVHLLRNPALAQQMGAEAQRRALEQHNFDRYVEAWVGVMERAVALGKRS